MGHLAARQLLDAPLGNPHRVGVGVESIEMFGQHPSLQRMDQEVARAATGVEKPGGGIHRKVLHHVVHNRGRRIEDAFLVLERLGEHGLVAHPQGFVEGSSLEGMAYGRFHLGGIVPVFLQLVGPVLQLGLARMFLLELPQALLGDPMSPIHLQQAFLHPIRHGGRAHMEPFCHFGLGQVFRLRGLLHNGDKDTTFRSCFGARPRFDENNGFFIVKTTFFDYLCVNHSQNNNRYVQ